MRFGFGLPNAGGANEQRVFDFRTGRVDGMLAIIEHLAASVMARMQR